MDEMPKAAQRKSDEWREQWTLFEDEERFLFEDWIKPATLDDMAGKRVLEGGCGGGQHTAMVAAVAGSVVAVDLNTAELARAKRGDLENVTWIDADLATMDLGERFDVVFSIGVIHHTDDPDRTVLNLVRHVKPGGLFVAWVYSAEGNTLVRLVVEPARRLFLRRLPRRAVVWIARLLTAALVPVVTTVYRLPFLSFLPYYQYFQNFRRLGFERNVLNVFDKLNAPQTRFISRRQAEGWLANPAFDPGSTSLRPYVGVSWSVNGRLVRETC